MKELLLTELNTRQKLGMAMIAYVPDNADNLDYIVELIKNHSLGGVWINPDSNDFESKMSRIKAAADYPILIFCDAESGIADHLIGYHNAIGCTGSEELAYTFGKTVAVTARNLGYTVVCNPVLDLSDCNCTCGANVRSYGSDKYEAARLAKAEARGMHDGGILTVGKHYPGAATEDNIIDTHMGESKSYATKEELIDYNLYPYRELMKEGLLDGMMVKHTRYMKVDSENPASLSKDVINIIRELGFDGFALTDALVMMGIVARYGKRDGIGLSVARGIDIALPFTPDNKFAYEAMCGCYDDGLISDDRLDEAVRRVLEAQHKTLAAPKFTSLTDEDLEKFDRINRESVYLHTDGTVENSISKDGKHLFVLLTATRPDESGKTKQSVDTFSCRFLDVDAIADKVRRVYPNSGVHYLFEFPSPRESGNLLKLACEYDDVVFVTFFDIRPNIGIEELTPRIRSIMYALQATEKISTIMHFGNPYVLENLPHIPRVLIGTASKANSLYALDVLCGDLPALGVPTYDFKLK